MPHQLARKMPDMMQCRPKGSVHGISVIQRVTLRILPHRIDYQTAGLSCAKVYARLPFRSQTLHEPLAMDF